MRFSDFSAQSIVLFEEIAVDRLYRLVGCGVVVALLVSLAGCPQAGPATVPVEGTLKIDGQPANDIGIDFVPLKEGVSTASGVVENGKFTLFAGVQGTPGAEVGTYKIVLRDLSGGGGMGEAAYKPAAGGESSKPAAPKLPFAAKYADFETSDKEIEVKAGGTYDIDVTSGGAADSGPADSGPADSDSADTPTE